MPTGSLLLPFERLNIIDCSRIELLAEVVLYRETNGRKRQRN